MITSAKRFEFLDKETSIAVGKFGSDVDAGVYNSPLADGLPSSEKLKELINSALQTASGIKSKAAGAKDAYGTVTRGVKGVTGTLTDIKSLSVDKLGSYFNEITGANSTYTKSLLSVAGNCSANGMNYGIPGKPYSPSINCGSGKLGVGTSGSSTSCNASSYGDLINKLTGGGYASTYQDLNSALRKIMALAGYGYNLGMCGVFGALGTAFGSESKDMLSKASGSLLGAFGASGNTNAVLDIAKSSVGLYPRLTNPSIVTTFLDNFTLPSNVTESGLSLTADRTLGGLELIDDKWSCSAYDDMPSISSVNTYSPDLGKAFDSKLTDRSYGADELDDVDLSDDDFTMGAYQCYFA